MNTIIALSLSMFAALNPTASRDQANDMADRVETRHASVTCAAYQAAYADGWSVVCYDAK